MAKINVEINEEELRRREVREALARLLDALSRPTLLSKEFEDRDS